MKPQRHKLLEFLRESNAIEGVYSNKALEDADRAWTYAYANRNKILTEEYVLEIHERLMKRLNSRIAGKFRKCAVQIGRDVKYDYSDLDKRVRSWIKDTFIRDHEKNRKRPVYDRDDITRERHIDFEDIHPFEDGNGRTGRILYNIHRINLGLPLHIIHEGDEQYLYYDWFRQRKEMELILKLSNKDLL